MTQKIKVTAEMEIEDDMALDGLSMDTSLGLLGTIKSYDIKYEENKKEKPRPRLTYDEIKARYFVKDINIDTVRKEIISAFMTQESDKFHDFAVEAIDEAVLKIDPDDVADQDKESLAEILNEEYYTEVLATKELKKKHGIE
jgi:hypothetical protein|tara:strand:- start:2162 stop:2587 length:426 start_codon:yes stop_codon:yes gene_type:complete